MKRGSLQRTLFLWLRKGITMLHIYQGDGKGKTTAAVGLTVRMRGAGMKVAFVQFLKDGDSHEIEMLKQLGVVVLTKPMPAMFVDMKNPEMIKEVTAIENALFEEIPEDVDAIVLDEVLDAITLSLINEGSIFDKVASWCEEKEVIMTGRQAGMKLKQLASYVTEMKKKKHPYEKGILAREGIEY